MNKVSFITTLVVLVFVASLGEAKTGPPKPHIYPQFRSRLVVNQGGRIMKGDYLVDEPNMRIKTSYAYGYDLLTPYKNLETFLFFKNQTSVFFLNGQCRQSGFGYYKPFFWLPISSYNGSRIVNNVLCDIWVANLNGTQLSFANNGSAPVQLNISINGGPGYQTDYYDVMPVDSFPSALFEPNPGDTSCTTGPVCDSGEVREDDIYRFHQEGEFDLGQHNVADSLGDAYFICTVLLGYRPSQDNLLSLYKVQWNTTWGQYEPCNNGACVGLNDFQVGHELTEGVTWLQGQCHDGGLTNCSADCVGNWYSLESSLQCPSDAPVGYVDPKTGLACAWKDLGLVKTVSLDCLRQQGMQQTCQADGHLPFTQSARLLEKALASDDPSEGGCPAVSSSSSKPQERKTSPDQLESQEPLTTQQLHELLYQLYSTYSE